MIKRILILLALLASLSAKAEIISYNGYSLDTDTNIVSGGGLEWLQWDLSTNQSIYSALDTYSSTGWRLASNTEMAVLFNAFDFGLVYDSDENTSQYYSSAAPLSSFGPSDRFISIFGQTNTSTHVKQSFALYGEDSDSDGNYNLAIIRDERAYYSISGFDRQVANLLDDSYIATDSAYNIGVALVRISPIPIPSGGWLFASALLGLAGLRRGK